MDVLTTATGIIIVLAIFVAFLLFGLNYYSYLFSKQDEIIADLIAQNKELQQNNRAAAKFCDELIIENYKLKPR